MTALAGGAAPGRATPWLRRPRLAWVALGVVVVTPVALAVALQRSDGSAGTTAATAGRRDALVAYATAIESLAKEGGQVVVLGLKPGLADIGQRRFPRATLVRMATGWVRALTRTSAAVAAVPTLDFLADAKALYDQALRQYVATARLELAAARADGAQRTALLTRAASFGRQADASFDRAKTIVDSFRAQLGLATDQKQG